MTQEQPSLHVLSDIQLKKDGSFLLNCNGYPFHATKEDTPEVYAQVIAQLAGGAEYSEYVEPVPPQEALELGERTWRDQEIERVSWLRDRHRDELELEIKTSLSAGQYTDLLSYLQNLRDWPQSTDFPDVYARPLAPPWITEQTL